VHALIKALFVSLQSPEKALAYFKTAKISGDEIAPLTDSFRRVMQSAHQLHLTVKTKSENQNRVSYSRFVVGSALFSLKRAFLSEAFYLPAIDGVVRQLCNEKTPDDIAPLINSYSEIADWIFEPINTQIYLYKSPTTLINYCQMLGQYTLVNHNVSHRFECYSELYSAIQNLNSGDFHINDFSYVPYFERLQEIIPYLEIVDIPEVTSHD
jgi:hypothetical protein